MKSFAHIKILPPLLIVLSLTLAPLIVSDAMGDDEAKTNASATSRSEREAKDASEGKELEFGGVEPSTDPFIVDEFYDAVKMQRLKGNVSGGVTPDGLNLRFDW